MYLREILGEIKKHMVENKILKEDAAINLPLNTNGGKLIDLTDESTMSYMLVGKAGRQDYRAWEPIIEDDNGKKICTYVVYSPLFASR